MRYRETHLLDAGYTAVLLIAGVIGTHIRQGVHLVKLILRYRHGGLILHEHPVAMALLDDLTAEEILLILLNSAGYGVFLFGIAHILKRRAFNADIGSFAHIDTIAGAAYIVQLRDILAAVKARCYLDH